MTPASAAAPNAMSTALTASWPNPLTSSRKATRYVNPVNAPVTESAVVVSTTANRRRSGVAP